MVYLDVLDVFCAFSILEWSFSFEIYANGLIGRQYKGRFIAYAQITQKSLTLKPIQLTLFCFCSMPFIQLYFALFTFGRYARISRNTQNINKQSLQRKITGKAKETLFPIKPPKSQTNQPPFIPLASMALIPYLSSNCYNTYNCLEDMDIWNYKTQGFNYEKYRPAYPPELCRHAIQPLSNRKRYLDLAVGTGKILLSFCDYFEEVKGIDVSDQMLQVARANVSKYMETHPKHSSILLQKSHVLSLNEEEKFDLITVGQALHFFPGKQTLIKLRNMLNEGGMFMAFGYVLREVHSCNPKENQNFYEFYDKMLPYFTFDMYELHRHYTDKEKYPFDEIFEKVDRKQTDLVLEVSKEDYINYLKTWSAYNICMDKEGVDPIVELEEKSQEKLTCVFDYFRVRCYN